MGAVRELFARNALKQRRYRNPTNTIIDTPANTGDLLHAMLESLIVAEISHAISQQGTAPTSLAVAARAGNPTLKIEPNLSFRTLPAC